MTVRLFVHLAELAVCTAAVCFVAGVWVYQIGSIVVRRLTS